MIYSFKPRVIMIAARAQNDVIGVEGTIPWHVPADMAHFKRETMGHAVVMGRKTWESMGCKPLPGRTNIVITRTPGTFMANGAVVVESVEGALAYFHETYGHDLEKCLYVIGGAQIYRAMLDHVDEIVLTTIQALPSVEGRRDVAYWDIPIRPDVFILRHQLMEVDGETPYRIEWHRRVRPASSQ